LELEVEVDLEALDTSKPAGVLRCTLADAIFSSRQPFKLIRAMASIKTLDLDIMDGMIMEPH
jgi:hypothetical protein